MKIRYFVPAVLLLVAGFFMKSAAQINLLSGIESGSYNRIADDIKKISTQPVSIQQSGGSSENYEKLTTNDAVNVTFLQYDVLIYKDLLDFSLSRDIQVLLPLGYEEIHLITYNDSSIQSFEDLNGKTVAIGSQEQGTNVTAKLIQRKTGIRWNDVEVEFNDAFVQLLMGEVDAFLFVGAAPVTKLKQFNNQMQNVIRLVPIEHQALEKIYKKCTIKAGTYSWADYDVQTYALPSILAINAVYSDTTDEQSINQLLLDIKNNIHILQEGGHPVWKKIDFSFADLEWPVYRHSERILTQ